MTNQFGQARNVFLAVLLALAIGPVLAGCGTSAIEDAVPQGTIRNTGVYPNINIVPKGETTQFSASGSAAAKAELRTANAEVKSGAAKTTTATESELREIAQSHAQETIDEIEAE